MVIYILVIESRILTVARFTDERSKSKPNPPQISDFGLTAEWTLPPHETKDYKQLISIQEMNQIESVLIEMVDLSRGNSAAEQATQAQEQIIAVQRRSWKQAIRDHLASILIVLCTFLALAAIISIKFSESPGYI